ncbi:hypothetical protein QI36_19440 [Salmonella enterica]|nr:hypothetical protein [Salmonella enterica]
MSKLNRRTYQMLCTVLFIAGCGQASAGTQNADLTITARVLGDCTISLSKSTVDLGKISADKLIKTSHNTRLDGMSDTITVTSTCPGTSAAKLSASTTSNIADGYISPEGDALRFGVETSYDSKVHKFDPSSKSTTLNDWSDQADLDKGHAEDVEIFALAGTSMSPKPGTYQATITFKLEPE